MELSPQKYHLSAGNHRINSDSRNINGNGSHSRTSHYLFLALFCVACQLATQLLLSFISPSCSTPTMMSLDAVNASYTSGISVLRDPHHRVPSPAEYWALSRLATHRRQQQSLQTEKENPDLSSLTLTDALEDNNKPTLILYVGLPDVTPCSQELQCPLCLCNKNTSPRLAEALRNDHVTYLGACPHAQCNSKINPDLRSHPSSSIEQEEEQVEVQEDPHVKQQREVPDLFYPDIDPLYFFSRPDVYEFNSSDTTALGRLLPHTLEQSRDTMGHKMELPYINGFLMHQIDNVNVLLLQDKQPTATAALIIYPEASMWSARHIRRFAEFLRMRWNVHVLLGAGGPCYPTTLLEYYTTLAYHTVGTQFQHNKSDQFLWPGEVRREKDDHVNSSSTRQENYSAVGAESLEQQVIVEIASLLHETMDRLQMHPIEIVHHNFALHFGHEKTHYVGIGTHALPKQKRKKGFFSNFLCDVLSLHHSCLEAIRMDEESSAPIPAAAATVAAATALEPSSSSSSSSSSSLSSSSLLHVGNVHEIWTSIQIDAVACAAYRRNNRSMLPNEATRRNVINAIRTQLENSDPTMMRSGNNRTIRIIDHLHQHWPLICSSSNSNQQNTSAIWNESQKHAYIQYAQQLDARIYQLQMDMNHQSVSLPPPPQLQWTASPPSPPLVFDAEYLLCHVDTDAILNDRKYLDWKQVVTSLTTTSDDDTLMNRTRRRNVK